MQKGNNESKSVSTYRESLRERILETAMRAFTSRGIKAVKMDDIAHELSISKRTLYELYENKELLLFAGIRQYKARKERELHELLAQSRNVIDLILLSYHKKVEESSRIAPAFYSDIERYPTVVSYLEKDREENHRRFSYFIKQGISEGFFRRDIDIELLTSAFEAVILNYMSSQIYKEHSVEDITKNIIFITIRGICTQKGIEALDNFFATSV